MEFGIENIDGERFAFIDNGTERTRAWIPPLIPDEDVLGFLKFLENLWTGDQSGGECVGIVSKDFCEKLEPIPIGDEQDRTVIAIMQPETLCGKPVKIVNRDPPKTDGPPVSLLDALRMLNKYWEGK